jgi:hypothetical protein
MIHNFKQTPFRSLSNTLVQRHGIQARPLMLCKSVANPVSFAPGRKGVPALHDINEFPALHAENEFSVLHA